ncbi:5656_t:CDS:1, partial [Paraglomus brasilianum]
KPTTSCFTTPTSPINHQTTSTPIPMVQTLTPTSASSITSSPDAMVDTDFCRFYTFYQTFQEQANKDYDCFQYIWRINNSNRANH